jgi:hypothetical protein
MTEPSPWHCAKCITRIPRTDALEHYNDCDGNPPTAPDDSEATT